VITLLRYELKHYWTGSGSALLSLACYFTLLFVMGYATQHHAPTSSNVIDTQLVFQWIAMFVSSLLAFERIWADDARDHVLAQQKLSPHGLGFFIALKIIAFWISICLPLIVIYAIQYALKDNMTGIMLGLSILPFILSSLIMTLLLVLSGALALGSRNGMLIVFLVMMPLMLPALTFGLGAHIALNMHHSMASALSLLGAYGLFNLVLVPCAVHYILRHHRS
jgi:heme exporter protein B